MALTKLRFNGVHACSVEDTKLAQGIPRPFKQYYYNGGINVIIINNNYSSYII